MTPKALAIIEALAARLVTITQANGFFFDIGPDNTYRGRQYFDGDTELDANQPLQALATLVDGPQKPAVGHQGTGQLLAWPISAQAFAICDPDNPSVAGHKLLADLKQALQDPDDPRLGGLVVKFEFLGGELIERERGSDVVGAALDINIQYIEAYGRPNQ